ncbi:site-specific DNA-methyltransferase [Lacrimispora celerecrescens]|uniref:site-specific DNA-methyltransferase n=1 Tax=Lacrimispora celerecrescens TaxID=29354 RepID=UPI001648DA04|nr:site-specific DNA-methyltransferase [Lacrimispora celerecrescens]
MPTLEWIGKDKVVNHHLDVPYRVLEHQYSYNESGKHKEDINSENMIIHGDNLLALKSLLPRYEGQIKCIYIDPPYNTGTEGWVYNDNVNDPVIRKWLGEVVGPEGEDLSRHDKWLCMIYPRLKLLQRLLANDGVIFINIGEDEHSNLKLVCDEIFGARNYVTDFGRQMKSGGAKGRYYTPSLDYILTYAKNIDMLPYFRAVMTQKQIDVFYKFTQTEGPRKGEKYGEERLFKSSLEARANQRYYIQCPDGSYAIPPGETKPEKLQEGLIVTPLKTDKVWKWIYPRYQQEYAAGNIIFKRTKTSGLLDENGKQCKWNIYNKLWLNEQQEKGVVPSNLITDYENRQSAAELKNLHLNFNFAKPVRLIQYMLTISQQDKNAIILDSFAGSGTTAHAVLNMNKADGGHRKFILVEMGDYADAITAERVKRVIDGYGEGKNAVENTGGDFSYYELGETLMNGDNLNEDIGIDKIREYVYFTETKCRLNEEKKDEPFLLGVHINTAYYFYYDKDAVTILNRDFLHSVKTRSDSYVMYADLCTLSQAELEKYHITFKKIPRDITRL